MNNSSPRPRTTGASPRPRSKKNGEFRPKRHADSPRPAHEPERFETDSSPRFDRSSDSSSRPLRTERAFVEPDARPNSDFYGDRTLVPIAAQKANQVTELLEIKKLVEGEERFFTNFAFPEAMHKALAKSGFVTPTPIQFNAIPPALEGRDLIGIAQTGTGKTLAFGLPILEGLFTRRLRGRALIILPTRELALQVEESLRKIVQQMPKGSHIRMAVLIGGAPIRPQQSQLRLDPDIIVATPGRLIDHLNNGHVDLRSVEVLVLDEADRMLDMGFAPQIRQIVRATPEERQTLLFSATMPDEITKMSQEFLREPARIEIERPGTKADKISQELFVVNQENKLNLLSKVLFEQKGSVLIFARTRSRASKVAREVKNWGIGAAEIHSDRTLSQRRQALDGFKDGRYRVLVATDIASRGIDVKDISVVVNFDLPDVADDYVHRIGRTGRAGATGHAISFAAPDQWRDIRDIEKVMEMPLELSENNEGEFDRPVQNAGRPKSAGFNARRGGAKRNFNRR